MNVNAVNEIIEYTLYVSMNELNFLSELLNNE